MKEETLILDFSSVYKDGGFIGSLRKEREPFRLVGLSDIPGTSCFLDPSSELEILSRTGVVTERFRWIDTGDYHYVSKLFSDFVEQPFTLLLLDNHPDDGEPAFGGFLSCGSWVRDVRRNPLFRRQLSIGPAGRRDKLSLSPSDNVYISIDLDVLGRDCSRTDWSQGDMSLGELEEVLDEVRDSGASVLAVDICGGISSFKGAVPEDFRINLETWIRLHHYLKQNFSSECVCS